MSVPYFANIVKKTCAFIPNDIQLEQSFGESTTTTVTSHQSN